ncbi:pilus assembly protein PilP [Thiocystis violascens]|uniref:Tfp pilus assembly protein PilP n=1 Tax=Thiocystis violascens (strain ATCC 17096 / DSM 198 / 6111) TaxID=765911 RepID=I3YCP9_THIV6|nr:pilus assembly protein PilP [Thiocystis violascens]AFL74767.1 Tfp pilus assembly protein PilP [Thiocystis violascens DSM 198]
MNRHRILILSLLTPVLIGGCGGDRMSELEAYAQSIKARPPGPIQPLPEIKPIETFVYLPGERRDPFTPDAEAMPPEPLIEDNGLAPDPNRRKEELEGFPLDSLRMVGTLDQDAERWGLVRTKDGIVHRVKVGNYLGMNNGQITNISEDAIQLIEIVSDAPGQWRERPATVALTQ